MQSNVLIVGLGNMGSALARGLIAAKFDVRGNLQVFDSHPDKASSFKDIAVNDLKAAMEPHAVVLCVKPHDLSGVAADLSGVISNQTVVISILAGVSLHTLEQKFHHKGPMVRAMPNIAATVGCAATAMCHNESSSTKDKELAWQIFEAVGEASWTKESLLDTVTGLSGSGPAYIYMVIEALTDGGVKMGLPRELSAKLASQTVLGAATLVKKSGIHPAILKDQVSTPAGTTISALHELESRGLRSMFVNAVEVATERSGYLGRQERQK